MRDDPDILDPTFSRTYVGTVVMTALCDKLFDFDAKLNIVPVLATGLRMGGQQDAADPIAAWRAVPERREIRCRCGEIHAGAPPQCQRQLSPQRDRRDGPCRGGRSADRARGDETGVLAVRRHPDRPRRHDAAAEGSRGRGGKDFGLHPVCAGPFRFVERVAQDHITLERFPGYWDASRIHYDRVTYRIIPDSSIRLAKLAGRHAGSHRDRSRSTRRRCSAIRSSRWCRCRVSATAR